MVMVVSFTRFYYAYINFQRIFIFKVFFDFSEGGIVATETRNDGKASQSKVFKNLKKF